MERKANQSLRVRSVDAEVGDDAGVREDFVAIEGHLIDEDGDECVPDGLARPWEDFGWCGEWVWAVEEEENFLFVGYVGEFGGGDGGWERGHVEFGTDKAVEVVDGADGGGFVVGEVDGEEFFAAEDEFYGVEAHRENCA